jgi:hypothetical protein
VGTPKELHEALLEQVAPAERYFPANPKSLSDHLRRDAPALRQMGIVVQTGLRRWLDGVSKRLVEVGSLPAPAPDDHPDEAAVHRHALQQGAALDAEALTQDAALTQGIAGAPSRNMLQNNDVMSSLTHLTQGSSTLVRKDVREDVVVAERVEGKNCGNSCVKVRQGQHNSNANNDLHLDAAANACVKAASRPPSCVKFWVGDRVAMKGHPNVRGVVNGYFPYEEAYTLKLEGQQFPPALQEQLYSPAGMSDEALIAVTAEEIALLETAERTVEGTNPWGS